MLRLLSFKTYRTNATLPANYKFLSNSHNLQDCVKPLFCQYKRGLAFVLPLTWYIPLAYSGPIASNVREISAFTWVNRLVEVYFPGLLTAVNFSQAKTVILTVKTNALVHVMRFFNNSMFFNYRTLTDIWAVDFPTRTNRFEITYSLLSNKRNTRIYIKIYVNGWEVPPSVVPIFGSAAWLEREVWDMFGIAFSGHPDLRRILTDYGFFGFPLRKDFPLTGFTELRYDDTTRRVASEHLNLIQELRLFFFSTPWKKK